MYLNRELFHFQYVEISYQGNRNFCSKGEYISTGNDTRARILQSSFDVVNNIKTPSGVSIWSSVFLAINASTIV